MQRIPRRPTVVASPYRYLQSVIRSLASLTRLPTRTGFPVQISTPQSAVAASARNASRHRRGIGRGMFDALVRPLRAVWLSTSVKISTSVYFNICCIPPSLQSQYDRLALNHCIPVPPCVNHCTGTVCRLAESQHWCTPLYYRRADGHGTARRPCCNLDHTCPASFTALKITCHAVVCVPYLSTGTAYNTRP